MLPRMRTPQPADKQGPTDLEDDVTAGFDLISTWDLDEHGVDWITKKIKQRVGTGPVVISLDVDVMDPSMVPASTFPHQSSPR